MALGQSLSRCRAASMDLSNGVRNFFRGEELHYHGGGFCRGLDKSDFPADAPRKHQCGADITRRTIERLHLDLRGLIKRRAKCYMHNGGSLAGHKVPRSQPSTIAHPSAPAPIGDLLRDGGIEPVGRRRRLRRRAARFIAQRASRTDGARCGTIAGRAIGRFLHDKYSWPTTESHNTASPNFELPGAETDSAIMGRAKRGSHCRAAKDNFAVDCRLDCRSSNRTASAVSAAAIPTPISVAADSG